MTTQFDKKRKAKEFAVGDRVLLNTRNLKFRDRPNCSKLMPRFVGPFTVTERVGNVSYRLTLPDTMKVHPVFHVELLREFKGNEFTPPPVLECEDGTVLWEIDRIAAERGKGLRKQYLVQWKGFGREFDSWEPAKVLMLDCPQAITEFEEWIRRHPPVSRKRKRPRT